MIREVQKTDTVIYTIGLLGQENKKEAKRARKALEQIASASGGLAFFPENVDDVHSICEQVAHSLPVPVTATTPRAVPLPPPASKN